MSDIVLSAGVRSNLLQLQQTSDLITQTQDRLSTGKKVNSALDNAINFFTAQGLTTRANDLNGLLDSMTNGVNTIQAANNGITAITKLVQSAQSLVSQAQQTTDPTTQTSLATQFNSLLGQIGQLAGDSGYNGVNLLGRQHPDDQPQRNGHVEHQRRRRRLHRRHRGAAQHRQRGQQLGERGGYHGRGDRSERRADVAARGVPDAQLEPVDRGDPPGFHEIDDQHAAIGRRQPHARRQQRRRRQPARLADPPAIVVHRLVARFAGRPERAATVPVTAAIRRGEGLVLPPRPPGLAAARSGIQWASRSN